jgi:ubiquinone/menaquinone biosynthesis C-methylase UbiE
LRGHDGLESGFRRTKGADVRWMRNEMTERNEPIGEYLDGHKERGGTYDQALSADPFDAYMTAWETRHVHDLLARAFPAGIGRYLDFACGTGRVTTMIAPVAREIVGVDVSASMLEIARTKLAAARFLEADLTSQEVDIGTFDLVSSFRFFGNAEHELRRAVLGALSRRIRPGGYLLVNSHRNPWALLSVLDRLGGGRMQVDLTYGSFKSLLREAGLEIAAVRPIAVWQFRHALSARAGSNPRREAKLERMFSAPLWARIAPDAVILARKT